MPTYDKPLSQTECSAEYYRKTEQVTPSNKCETRALLREDVQDALTEMFKSSEKKLAAEVIAVKPLAEKKSRTHTAKIVSDILFYLIIALLIATAFFYGTKEISRSYFGYSYANVLTRSMQSEIPKGSLVLIKQIDPYTIKVGDDITYIRKDNSTVTHRVMAIHENYEDSGVRGFVTKGTDNVEVDPDVIHPDNVIGIVKFHIAYAGEILLFTADHIWIIVVVFALLLLLSMTLRSFFKEVKRERTTTVN